MLIIERLSKLLPGRSPTQPATPQQTTNSPPSDAISGTRPRTESSGERGALFSPVGSVSAEDSPLISDSTRHAEPFQPSKDTRFVRSLARQTIPRPGLGMGRLRGEEKSAGTKERDREDEQRLFPSFGRQSPGAVSIVPGQQTYKSKKKLQGIASFKPINTLSSKSRDSGPVRAQRKQSRRGGSQSNYGFGFQLEDAETSPRPSKRRRESQDTTSGKAISVSDDDIAAQNAPETSSIAGNSVAMSSTSSQPSKRPSKRNKVDEYRQVERNIRVPRAQDTTPKLGSKKFRAWSLDDEQDERFTENAARERRSLDLNPGNDFAKPRQLPKHELFQSVEINGSSSTARASATPPPQTQSNAVEGPRRAVVSRESPDELQGAATVQPAPTFLGRGGKTDVSAEPEGKGPPTTRDRQQSSPSDIRPTVFASTSQRGQGKSNKGSKSRKDSNSPCRSFKATFIRIGSTQHELLYGETVDLGFDTTSGKISFPGNSDSLPPLSMQRVCRVVQGIEPSRKIRLHLSKTEYADNMFDIELSSAEAKDDLCALLVKQGAKMQLKPSEWMDKMFKKTRTEPKQPANGIKRLIESVPEQQEESEPKSNPEIGKRVKLSESLQVDDASTTGQKQPVSDTASPPTSGAQKGHAVEIPVKKFNPLSSPPARATRSMARRSQPTTLTCDDEKEDQTPEPSFQDKGKKWYKSLVYPRVGKKKAEVDAQDLDRLRPHEFLNDNLIGFYIRFLEDHLDRSNKEVAKRVYFYNSYFFATLTNGSKGKRDINYEGVQKWTRNVDIFSHDYVVVPINEKAHWYVAIICNLPCLPGVSKEIEAQEGPSENEKETSERPGVEGPEVEAREREIPETPEPSQEVPSTLEGQKSHNQEPQPVKEEQARQSLASMSLVDESSQKDDSEAPPTEAEWPEKEETPTTTTKISSPTGKAQKAQQADSKGKPSLATPKNSRNQKKKSVGTKHDVCQPIVITFDSLDLPRSPTISILRHYLYEEAKSKRGVEIDTDLIKGMRAREIPEQPNYSDCGLYLLAYLEKFVQDPDSFVRDILQRKMRMEDDWPPLRPGLLRNRLRSFLDDLYDEQENIDNEKEGEKEAMVDRQPISYLLGSLVPRMNGEPGCSKTPTPQAKSPIKAEPVPRSPQPRPESVTSATDQTKPPTVHDADEAPKSKRTRAQQSSKPEQPRSGDPEPSAANTSKPSTNEEVVEVPDSQEPVQQYNSQSPRPARKKETKTHRRERTTDSPESQKAARVDEEAKESSVHETSTKPQTIEVQVARTPPPPSPEVHIEVKKGPKVKSKSKKDKGA